MGSLLRKPPKCKSCGREMVVKHWTRRGPHCRPCVCTPRPNPASFFKPPVPDGPSDVSSLCIRPEVDLRPSESKLSDLLSEDEREFVEDIRTQHGRRHIHKHLLDIIDRLAPRPEVRGEY